MIRDILLTASAVLTAAFLLGLGWYAADRRGRTDLAAVRAALGDQVHEANHAADEAYAERDRVKTRLDACEVELDAMTDAHHRGAEEYERLLEMYREVPEAFRATLGQLDRERDVRMPPVLFDAYDIPRPNLEAEEALRLAAMLDAPTGAWRRVVYRPVPAADADTVHEGELLDRAGVALVPTRTYPAKPQRKGGKRR